jgi:hypothetical protein
MYVLKCILFQMVNFFSGIWEFVEKSMDKMESWVCQTLPEHLSSPPVFSEVYVTQSLVLYVCFVDRCLSFCTFSFGHCVVCSSSIYGFSKFFLSHTLSGSLYCISCMMSMFFFLSWTECFRKEIIVVILQKKSLKTDYTVKLVLCDLPREHWNIVI